MGSEKKYLIIVGTRPEIIKMSPIVHEMKKREWEMRVLFTGQHFVPSMGTDMLREFGYSPGFTIAAKEEFSFDQFLSLMKNFDVVLVQGDTTTVALGAVMAVAQKKKLVHVEAGLRSGDMNMREERNRRMVDHASDLLLCPCGFHDENLRSERVNGRIVVVGNVIVDAMREYKSRCLGETPENIITLLRAELVDDPFLLDNTMQAIAQVTKGQSTLFILHPRTGDMIKKHGLKIPSNFDVGDPLPASVMWGIIKEAKMIFTDSGGNQEEACILGVPCFTIRQNTERQETLWCGANRLVYPGDRDDMVKMMSDVTFNVGWKHPYGENVTEKIMKSLEEVP